MLKSKYLDGKRNRRVDHLIHTLVVGMLPSYENKHDRQVLGLEGDNLGTKRRKEILARMPEINAESIQDLGDDKFSVQSSTDSSRTYSVELGLQSCDCPDWPRIRLCKHLAAAAHYFGNGDLQIEPAPKTAQPIREGSLGAQSDAGSAASIVENVIAVSRAFLNDGAPSSPATVRSLQMVESHLTAVVHISRSQEDPLPDKENLPPNQDTWAETAERMGAKRKRRSPPTGSSPEPPPSARELIGPLNRKKLRVKLTDPYSGGVSSGKRAAPDAQTAAQNAEARAHAAAAPSLSLSQPLKRGRKRAVVSTSQPPPPPAPLPSLPPPHAFPPSSAPPALPYTAAAAAYLSQTRPTNMHAPASAPLHPSIPPAWYPIPFPYPHGPYPVYGPYGYYLPPNHPNYHPQ